MKKPEKNQALQLLEQFCDAYKQRDRKQILSLFSKNCQMWGTGIDEYRVGLSEIEKQLERDWSQSQHGEIKIMSWIPHNNEQNWAAAICKALITIDGTQHEFEHLRGTITIAKEDGVWKIEHMHCSFPDMRNGAGESFPAEI